ncbi:TrmH family RNA methyltransferase, partial [Candidatus Gracilibacteria bacterium]|nr:TrmH family RNA methyltransferase [Candidatus Gracilibacteria bacterium]
QNYIDWEYYEDIYEVLNLLKNDGYLIYAVELTNTAIDYRELFNQNIENICLIMGNEVLGVSQKVLDFCDKHVIIPMKGQKNSLNVSVARGIVMYAIN